MVKCVLEVVHQTASSTMNNNANNTKSKAYTTSLSIKVLNKKNKQVWEKTVDFKTIIMISRLVLKSKEAIPCFCLFISQRSFPYIFLTSSDKKLIEWTNQISIYCHKLTGKNSLQNASSKFIYIYLTFEKCCHSIRLKNIQLVLNCINQSNET